jgi:hypothetical protein
MLYLPWLLALRKLIKAWAEKRAWSPLHVLWLMSHPLHSRSRGSGWCSGQFHTGQFDPGWYMDFCSVSINLFFKITVLENRWLVWSIIPSIDTTLAWVWCHSVHALWKLHAASSSEQDKTAGMWTCMVTAGVWTVTSYPCPEHAATKYLSLCCHTHFVSNFSHNLSHHNYGVNSTGMQWRLAGQAKE